MGLLSIQQLRPKPPVGSGDEPLEVLDADGTGSLVLPYPTTKSAEEVLAHGPVTVFARPTSVAEQRNGKLPVDADRRVKAYVVIPEPPEIARGVSVVWHYTDARGVIGIVQRDALWATAILAMNDSREYRHGLATLEGQMEEFKRSRFYDSSQKKYVAAVVDAARNRTATSGLFALCASTERESLAQYRTYGGEHPHAIGLDPTKPLAVLADEVGTNTVESIPIQWRRVLYRPDDQVLLIRRVLGYVAYTAPFEWDPETGDEPVRSHATALVVALAHCKSPEFREESEVRVIVEAPKSSAIHFRPSRFGVAHYLELTGVEDADTCSTNLPKPLPISWIVVGPFGGREVSGEGVTALVKSTAYRTQTTVARSESSLR